MTKPRTPLTTEYALERIAVTIGWDAVAAIGEVQERHARKWGDPDAPERLPANICHLLDAAYQEAGGEGAPLYETHGLLLESTRAERFANEILLGRQTIDAIKEGGEAHTALVAASLPGASDLDRTNAIREVQEAIAALTGTLSTLTRSTVLDGDVGSAHPRGGER